MNNRKSVKLIAFLMTITFLFSACGAKGESSNEEKPNLSSSEGTATSGTVKITDSAGREVEIPSNIAKVAPSGAVAEITLYTLAKDKMVGWSSSPDASLAKYIDEEAMALPEFGRFYGKKANLNLEALIAAGPDLIIDVGEAKDGIAEDMDTIAEQTGIPVIFIEGTLMEMGNVYRTLGKILGEEAKGIKMADYIDGALKDAGEKRTKLKDEDLKRVYIANNEDGLSSYPKASYHTDVLDFIGINNVLEESDQATVDLSLESVIASNPEVILVSPDGAYESIIASKEWADIDALKNSQTYEIPKGPYAWTGRPPAVNRILGVKWAGNLLYPEVYDYDMTKEVQEFYSLFYEIELTDEEANEFMINSQK